MAEKTTAQIAQELMSNKGTSGLFPPQQNPLLSNIGKPIGLPDVDTGRTKISPVRYNVDPNAIYDRLSDGSYVAKFENYIGAEGNEDRLAKQQGTGEKILYGLGKNFTKMGNYMLDATVGTVYGLYKGLADQDFSSVWDNSFSNTLDDWNKSLDYKLPNYYTDEEKSMGFLQSMGTANFWANDMASGLAFIGGALIPEYILGAATGGTTLAGGLAKTTLKLGAKTADPLFDTLKMSKGVNTVDKISEAAKIAKGKEILRNYNRAIYASKTGDALSTAGFLLRTSNFEAGMEARHNFKESLATFYETFEKENGRAPSYEEMMDFTDAARSSANGVYAANLAILSVSNAAMFGKAFDIRLFPEVGRTTQNFFNRAIGLGTKKLEDGTEIMLKASKPQKITGTLFKFLEGNVVEGVYEEGLQGVAGRTMQNYLESLYDSNNNESLSFLSSLTDAFSEQYGTKEGWKEIGLGMLIGFVGGGITGRGLSGIGKNSYNTRRREIEEDISRINKGIENLSSSIKADIADTRGVSVLRAMSKASVARASREAVEGEYAPVVDNLKTNISFIQSQEHLKSLSEIEKDYNLVIDKMELSQDQLDALEMKGVTVDEYKDNLRTEFAETVSNYKFAKKATEALRLDGTTVELSPGNRYNVKEAMMWNLMLGKTAATNAKRVAGEIDQIVGTSGILDSLSFYNALTKEDKVKASELRATQRKLDELSEKAIDLQNQLANIQARRQKGVTDATLDKRYSKVAEKYAVLSQTQAELKKRKSEIEKALDKKFDANTFILEEKVGTAIPMNIMDVIGAVDKVNDYINSLKAVGKDVEAETLQSLVTEFKVYADSHNELISGHRKMVATNFFNSEEGVGLLGRLIGPKYEISPEFRQVIRDNEMEIDRSLGLMGVRGYENAEQAIELAIEKNPHLSEREKFKLESVIRLQLNMQAFDKTMDVLSEVKNVANAEKVTPEMALEGDTVAIRRAINITADRMDSVDVIDQAINTITSEIDALRKTVQNPAIRQALEKDIEALKKRREEIVTGKKAKTFDEIALDQLIEDLRQEEASEFRNEEIVNDLKEQIRNQRKKIRDAAKKSKESEQEGRERGDQLQYQGVDEGQQEEGQGARRQGQAEEYGPDQGYSNITSKEEIDRLIAEREKELADLKNGVRIMDSPEYARLMELLAKQDAGTPLSEQETTELDELKADMDQWLLVTGTVVEGVRLSDLIRQKVALDNIAVAPLEQVAEVTAKEVIDETEFQDSQSKANYTYGLTFEAVYVSYNSEDESLNVSGIREEDIPVVFSTRNADGTSSPIDFNYEIDPRTKVIKIIGKDGGTLEDELAKINVPNSNISLYPTNKDLNTTYSVAIAHEIDVAGNVVSTVAKTDYTDDYTVPQEADAIYDLVSGDALTFKIDTRDGWNKNLLAKLKNAKNKKERDAAMKNLKEQARITIFTKDGKFIATLKGSRPNAKKNDKDLQFEQFRNEVFRNDSFVQKLLTNKKGLHIVETAPITVKRTLMGHPNFLFEQNEDGTVSFKYIQFDDTMAGKISDIGYAFNGKMQTRSGLEGVDTTFLKGKMKSTPDKKIPFVVFQIGSRRIAYPVQLIRQPKQDNSEFEKILNSKVDAATKVIRLNKLLAQRGLDVTQPGNFFYAAGNTNNLNSQFLSDKLAQIDQIDYFYPLDEWLKNNVPVNEILKQQALINIDLSRPLHSPKVVMNMDEVLKPFTKASDVDAETKQKKSSDAKKNSTGNTKTTTTMKDRLGKLTADADAKKNAQKKLDEDC